MYFRCCPSTLLWQCCTMHNYNCTWAQRKGMMASSTHFPMRLVFFDSPVVYVGCHQSIHYIHCQVLTQALQDCISTAAKELFVAVAENRQSASNAKNRPWTCTNGLRVNRSPKHKSGIDKTIHTPAECTCIQDPKTESQQQLGKMLSSLPLQAEF